MSGAFVKIKNSELGRPGMDEYAIQPKLPLIVVLDNIRSLHNIGSIFRTCDAFSVSEIFLCGFTAKPPHREIHKTALGATETVKWRHFSDASEAVRELKRLKASICPVEQSRNSTPANVFSGKTKKLLAIVFGNEVDGVSDIFLKNAAMVIEIPQQGTKHSLNVSVAAGIVIWEIFRKSL